MAFESGFSTVMVTWVKNEDRTCCTVRAPDSKCWSLLLSVRAAPAHGVAWPPLWALGQCWREFTGWISAVAWQFGGWQQLLLCQQQLMW